MLPQLRQLRRETIIAVNVGGCVIPLAIATYEIVHLVPQAGMPAVLALAVGVGVNIAVCFAVAKPVPEVGTTMPAFLPAIVTFVQQQSLSGHRDWGGSRRSAWSRCR